MATFLTPSDKNTAALWLVNLQPETLPIILCQKATGISDEHSSGAKHLLGIIKKGNERTRTLLIMAANALCADLRFAKK